jgi:uncharacterized protein YecE (DUF72 family)
MSRPSPGLFSVAANARTSSRTAASRDSSRTRAHSGAPENPPNGIFIGTSGWAYSSWKPGFYPQALSQKKFLDYYATQLNSVEVNYTFRQLPSAGTLDNWLAASNAGFRFSFKAPQRITHILRLRDCSEATAALSQALAPMMAARRMGVVLFQLPPNFKADVPRLDAFLANASGLGLRMAFEFRHDTWFCDAVYDALRQHRVALCVAESDDLETPDVVTAPFACYRFRKSEYSAARLDRIENALRLRSGAGEVFAYFKHEDQPAGALHAADILRRLERS